MNLGTDLTPITKINSELTIDIKCQVIEALEDNTGENPGDFESDNF